MNSEKYEKNIVRYESDLKESEEKSLTLGYVKLLLAAGFIACFVLLVINWFSLFFCLLSVTLLGAFIAFAVIHSRAYERINYCKGMIRINGEYLSRIDGSWDRFLDDGREFADYNHSYTFDLDIFGAKSAYQFMNVTKSYFGRIRLRDDLSAPDYSPEQIARRQAAISELAGLDDFSHGLQYGGEAVKDNKDIENTIKYINESPAFLRSEILQQVLFYMPFLIVAFCLVTFIFRLNALYIMAYCLIGIQAAVWLGFLIKAGNYLSGSERIQYSLEKYVRMYRVIERQDFESGVLREIKSALTSSPVSAAVATKKLGGILQRIQLKRNILHVIFNIVFLWDIGCSISLSAWKKKYAEHFEKWLTSLGELESLLSFSVVANAVDTACLPTLSDKDHALTAKNIGHPLLNNGSRICNDFTLSKKINVISGSNMSGKTTFLRTVGLNLVLAKNGGFVCAREMTFSNMTVVSSMRISDDLKEGISTFYSELKKIKNILETAKENKNTIFLIDEIFRGTNSLDRISGAREVLKKLHSYGVCGFLTTHDLTLCEKISNVEIENYNFAEHYENGELRFNYKINNGIAKTTNGEYLMKLIGIIS